MQWEPKSDAPGGPDRKKRHVDRLLLGRGIGRFAQSNGVAATMNMFHVSRKKARYWKEKVANPLHHPGTWGGPRAKYGDFYFVSCSFLMQPSVKPAQVP